MQAHLTELAVSNFKPQGQQVTYWDTIVRGFGLRVSQAGGKSWVIMTGRDRKLTTFAKYPALSLKDARTEARKRLVAERPTEPTAITFKEALTLFLASS